MWQSEFLGAAGMYALPRSRCANYQSVPKQKGMIFTVLWGGVLGSQVTHAIDALRPSSWEALLTLLWMVVDSFGIRLEKEAP